MTLYLLGITVAVLLIISCTVFFITEPDPIWVCGSALGIALLLLSYFAIIKSYDLKSTSAEENIMTTVTVYSEGGILLKTYENASEFRYSDNTVSFYDDYHNRVTITNGTIIREEK